MPLFHVLHRHCTAECGETVRRHGNRRERHCVGAAAAAAEAVVSDGAAPHFSFPHATVTTARRRQSQAQRSAARARARTPQGHGTRADKHSTTRRGEKWRGAVKSLYQTRVPCGVHVNRRYNRHSAVGGVGSSTFGNVTMR